MEGSSAGEKKPVVEEPQPGSSSTLAVVATTSAETGKKAKQRKISRKQKVMEGEEDRGNRVVALDNPLILSTIASNLGFKDMKGFRLVNPFWMEATQPLWRKSYFLCILPNVPRLKPFAFGVGENPRVLNYLKFSKLFQTSETTGEVQMIPELQVMPFQCHKICDFVDLPPNIDKTTSDRTEELYWSHYGPYLRSLKIQAYIRMGEEVQGLEWIVQHCQNLQELTINPWSNSVPPESTQVRTEDRDSGTLTIAENLKFFKLDVKSFQPASLFGGNVELCKTFLKMVPKLKWLSIKAPWDEHSFLKALSSPVTQNTTAAADTYLQLHTMKFSDKLLSGDLQDLLNYLELAAPPLTNLKLTIDPEEIKWSPETFRHLMELLQGSLKTLKVTSVDLDECLRPGHFDLLSSFHFSELTDLHLKFDYGTGKALYYPLDFQLLKKTPNLKRLRLTHFRKEEDLWFSIPLNWMSRKLTKYDFNGGKGWALTDGSSEELDNALRMNSLEEFEFYRKMNLGALTLVSKWMPRIRFLKLALDKDTFAAVFTLFPFLQELTLLEHSKVSNRLVKQIEKQPDNTVKIQNLQTKMERRKMEPCSCTHCDRERRPWPLGWLNDEFFDDDDDDFEDADGCTIA